MPISLILTSFDYFQIRPSFTVTPNLILEPCHIQALRKKTTTFFATSVNSIINYTLCVKAAQQFA